MELHLESTMFGHLVRLLSRRKFFRYPGENDPSLWDKAVKLVPPVNSNGNQEYDAGKGMSDDGKCVLLVGWYGPDDPEVSIRFSSIRMRCYICTMKILISFHEASELVHTLQALDAFQMCIFNFAVYIASSIYTHGEPYLVMEFDVSQTVAILGLSLFTLLAYALSCIIGSRWHAK